MKHELQLLLGVILEDMGVRDVVPDVTISDDPRNGEYTTNIALKLAKPLKKSPMDIALQVKSSIEERISSIRHKSPDQKIDKKDQSIADKKRKSKELQDIDTWTHTIERVEVVSPGFINVFVSESALSSRIG